MERKNLEFLRKNDKGDKNLNLWDLSIGAFALCVKDKMDAWCGSPSIYLEIRLLRGMQSE